MSNISSVSTQNLLSSIAGTQRTDQAKERSTNEVRQNQQHKDILQLSIQKAENIADANSSTDRDAQGFYLPNEQETNQQDDQSQSPYQEIEARADNETSPNLDPDLGASLDLEV